MKILSAEQRTGGASPQQIPFPFSGMKQHSFLTSEADVYTWIWCTCFLIDGCSADNADLIFCALISLPMGLPLLVVSTDNKLDVCLGLEDCTADMPRMTRQLMLHWYIWDVVVSYTVFPHLRLGLCVYVCGHGLSCVCISSRQYLSHILFHKSKSSSAGIQSKIPTYTHIHTHIQIMQAASLIPVTIHTLILPYKTND